MINENNNFTGQKSKIFQQILFQILFACKSL